MAYTIIEKCIGCGLCRKNCPVGAISGEQKEKHEIDARLCVECGLCGRHCAAGAVQNADGETAKRVPNAEWEKPSIDEELCAGCSVCVENCPRSCLEISKPRFAGDIHTTAALARPDDCIGCGICASVCPIAAIAMTPPDKAVGEE